MGRGKVSFPNGSLLKLNLEIQRERKNVIIIIRVAAWAVCK